MRSRWFLRFERELPKISPHLRMVRLKHGFYRIYWKDHYVSESYSEMPAHGHDIVKYDPRLDDSKIGQRYYEEYEDHVKMVRTIKNFIEGYYDSIARIKTRVYMILHDAEFHETSARAYKQMVIK